MGYDFDYIGMISSWFVFEETEADGGELTPEEKAELAKPQLYAPEPVYFHSAEVFGKGEADA